MVEPGEWNSKGATLSDVTAIKDYDVSREFIVNGIKSGKLEYREGAMWGNPYLRILKNQLESYIAEQLGSDYLVRRQTRAELRKINTEIAKMKKKLAALQARKSEIEKPDSILNDDGTHPPT